MKKSSTEFSVALNMLSGILQATVIVIFYFLVFVAIKNATVAAYDFSFEVFGNVSVEAAPGRNVEVKIVNTNSKKVAALLKEKNVIVNEYSFLLREKLSLTKSYQIEPGIYVLNTSMSYEQILNTLTNTETEEVEDSTT